MSVGENALFSGKSYLAVGRETTGSFGTYNTATAKLDFLSASFKTVKESKILEEVTSNRTYAQQIRMGKVVEGEVEFYFKPRQLSSGNILQMAFGGTITSATATGETAGGGSFSHTFALGCFDQSYTALDFNHRKGDSSAAKVFQYSGSRVDELSFTAELDEALKCNAKVLCKDSTLTSNDVSSALTTTGFEPLSFVNGRLSAEATFASLTSSSFWHIQSVSWSMANSLKADNNARRIGSDTLEVLPAGIVSFEFSVTMRFDTSTAYTAMVGNSALAFEFEFQGDTLPTSVIREGLKLQMPKCRIMDFGDPEIGSADEILTSEVTVQVLRDDSSAGGYAVEAIVTNDTSTLG